MRCPACLLDHLHLEPRQAKTETKKITGIVFLQKKQEHGEAGTAKQGTEQSL
jgi:hypothetical protein